MKILIVNDESQKVCETFRKHKHAAFSCDPLPCSGKHPEWHIQDDPDIIITGFQKVVFADECTAEDWDEDREFVICPYCRIAYSECNCPGPTEDIDYKEINNTFYGKQNNWDLTIIFSKPEKVKHFIKHLTL